jgi:serine/threonine protein kinase
MDQCGDCRQLVAGLARTGALSQHDSVEPEADPEGCAADRPLVAGDLVAGRFEIVRRVGAGAMGIVYEALDRALDVRVALKALRPHASASPVLLDRLRREIVLGRRITHGNVCRLHDLGADRDLHFITMEFVDGETLAERMARGPIPRDEAIGIIAGICDALEAAHAESVVHRDLKPANVMITRDGRVCVMDLGLARDLRSDRSVEGAIIGTPAYWAPEQARGERATVRSDVYALGLIACELLGGKRPSWGEPLPDAVPFRHRTAIAKCLVTDPARRHASAKELREALTGRNIRLPRRSRSIAGGIGAAAAAAAIGVVAALLRRSEAPAARQDSRPMRDRVADVAASPAPKAVSPRVVVAPSSETVDAPASEPARPRRAAALDAPRGPREGVTARPSNVTPSSAPTAPPVVAPAAAPGGQWFFFE